MNVFMNEDAFFDGAFPMGSYFINDCFNEVFGNRRTRGQQKGCDVPQPGMVYAVSVGDKSGGFSQIEGNVAQAP